MTNFKRAFAGVSALALLSVTACAGQTAAQVTQTVVTDAQTLASGLAAELPSIEAIKGVSASTVATIQTALAGIQTEASALNTSLTATSAASVVTKIESDLNAVVAAAATIQGLPASVQTALTAAQVLLPVIEAGVNMVAPVGATPGSMTVDQAIAILKAA